MIKEYSKIGLLLLVGFSAIIISCGDSGTDIEPIITTDPGPDPTTETVETTITNLLTNQANGVIIPTTEAYQAEMTKFLAVVEEFVATMDDAGLAAVRSAYLEAYLAYQAVAVHNYYAIANADLVNTTNLYPIEVATLNEFIEKEAYNFNVSAQQRANGFPAIDYLLYAMDDEVSTFSNDPKTATFLLELVKAMKEKADLLVDRWTGDLRENFINNVLGDDGVALGSSVSVQLNRSLVYYEDHIRGNKVGLPIGRLGPNDTPIDADPTKIEGYYQSLQEGNEHISLTLLRAAIEEMEDLYLGTTSSGEDGIGYDDLLLSREQESLDIDIKAQYQLIYDLLDNRTSISGDEALFNTIQGLVTLYKSDLFPVLNVQDADGANDGD